MKWVHSWLHTFWAKKPLLTLFRMTLSGAAHGWGRAKRLPISKISHTYPIFIKLATVIPYLKKIQKPHKSRDKSLYICWYQHFSPEVSNSYYIRKYKYRLHFNTQFLILFTFFNFLKVVLINMATILMMSARLVTLSLLKTKAFWNKR